MAHKNDLNEAEHVNQHSVNDKVPESKLTPEDVANKKIKDSTSSFKGSMYRFLMGTFLMLIIFGIGFLAYYFINLQLAYNQRSDQLILQLQKKLEQSESQWQQQNSSINNQLSVIKDQLPKLNDLKENRDATLNNLNNELQLLNQKIVAINERLNHFSLNNQMQKIQVIELVIQQVQIALSFYNLSQANQLLDKAYLITLSSSDILYPIGEAIPRYQYRLNQVSVPNTLKIIKKLDWFYQQTERLKPLTIPVSLTVNTIKTDSNSQAKTDSWFSFFIERGQRIMMEVWNAINRLFVIQPLTEKASQALLLQGQSGLVKAKLQLVLQQLQLAVQQHHQPLYKQLIKMALSILSDNFNHNQSEYYQMKEGLESLNELNISPQLPEPTQILTVLNTIPKSDVLLKNTEKQIKPVHGVENQQGAIK